ncbi:MAG: glycosyltransferase family 4 protein [Bacteroidaceae bacterium]|nr:glycosyltransferase family 4 protein [Bacteroidaceae bacterium]
MRKVLFCTPYEGISNSNIGGIAVWAKAIVAYYRKTNTNIELVVQPLDRKTYVRGVNVLVRLWRGVVEYVGLIGDVKRKIKGDSYDVLHLCTTASLGLIKDWFILRYAKSKGLKTILHFHCGRIPEIIKSNSWETKLLRYVMKETDMPVVMDDNSLRALHAWGIERAVYIPNPLSTFVSDVVSESKDKISKVKDRLLFVGHIVDIKGVYELVEACSMMKDVSLRMVGHAEDNVKAELCRIAKRRQGNWLFFTGGLSRETTIKEILAADILIAPSYIEGFPNVILEAMACGTPIIASGVGAIPQMLDNGNCGLIIKPRSVDAIYDAICKLLHDEETKAVFANNSVRRVNRLYSISSVWECLSNNWNKV